MDTILNQLKRPFEKNQHYDIQRHGLNYKSHQNMVLTL
jgi:hypothetical protein